MKKESLNVLKEMKDLANSCEEVCSSAILNFLERIWRIEETKKNVGKFNIFDCCKGGLSQAIREGVYYDNGKKIATNGSILGIVDDTDAIANQGEMLYADGTTEKVENYPRYRSVLPKDLTKWVSTAFTEEQFQNAVKELNVVKKSFTKLPKDKLFSIGINGKYYDSKKLKVVMAFCKEKGVNTLYQDDFGKVYATNGEDEHILLMPLVAMTSIHSTMV